MHNVTIHHPGRYIIDVGSSLYSDRASDGFQQPFDPVISPNAEKLHPFPDFQESTWVRPADPVLCVRQQERGVIVEAPNGWQPHKHMGLALMLSSQGAVVDVRRDDCTAAQNRVVGSI